MKRSTHHSIGLLGLAGLLGLTTSALGVNLPPGGAAALPGSLLGPGVVVYDVLVPYEITDADGTTLLAGNVQDRVVRRLDNTLIFSKRLRDTQVDTIGALVAASVTNYTGYSCDVDWDPTSQGTHEPGLATRSVSGAEITYSFVNNPIHETEESRAFFAKTNALLFVVAGDMTLTLESGESTTITVASPLFADVAPEALITERDPLECVCDPVTISGIADAGGGTFDHYTLEYRRIFDPNWSLIGTFFAPVPAPGGVLAVWNTGGLIQDFYFLRLTVENTLGDIAVDTTIVWVDQQFDNLTFATPQPGDVVGGFVCPGGIIDDGVCEEEYTVEYSPDGVSYFPIDPINPIYQGPKINQTFGVWDSTTVADGSYFLLVEAVDSCHHIASAQHEVIVDNTAPTAIITDPVNCECVEGIVPVIGTADDANLAGWALQYSGGGNNNWVTIATGNTPVINGLLGNWDTNALLDCPYVLRLVVTDSAQLDCNGAIHHLSEFMVAVNVGCKSCAGDLNGDGAININDLLILIGLWGLCP
ncbi:MAG: hypothetical protein L0Y42_05845 [Phycisphaerales bacterium]|nr:hypothetical protein [Phycisphaerales bacterium]